MKIDSIPNTREFRRLSRDGGNVSSWDVRKGGDSSVVYGFIKVIIDVTIAVVGLRVLCPFILMVIAMLYVLQGRPIFVAHRRVGKNGETFSCLKFRTMVVDAEEALARYLAEHPEKREEWEATRKLRDDPRVTPLGAILRKNSIDEIPQLLNIIQGKMSAVGPRPITASEADIYGVHFADYIKVRPGLTGLWQVSGRSDTGYAERIQLDVRYICERSVLRDVRILLMTVPAVLQARGSY